MTRYRSTLDTPEQALAEALLLGLTGSRRVGGAGLRDARGGARRRLGLDAATVELAKAAALERFEYEAGAHD